MELGPDAVPNVEISCRVNCHRSHIEAGCNKSAPSTATRNCATTCIKFMNRIIAIRGCLQKLSGQTAEQQARTRQPHPCLGDLRQPIVMHDQTTRPLVPGRRWFRRPALGLYDKPLRVRLNGEQVRLLVVYPASNVAVPG